MFVVDLLVKSELLTRVSDEELVEESLNDARCCHLAGQTDTRQIILLLVTHTRSGPRLGIGKPRSCSCVR